MNENGEREILWVLCQVAGDRVRVDSVCKECVDWNGMNYGYKQSMNKRIGNNPLLLVEFKEPASRWRS